MIEVRRAAERGATRIDWLDSRHTFSFADYYDPRHMGFSVLRVLNDDRIAPARGFPFHPHRDMEILTYVFEGSLQHRDSLGTGSVLRAGDFQRMTAGTGIVHSEWNPSPTETLRLLQIWILPERRGLEPGYEERGVPPAERRGRFRLVASRDARDGSLRIHQDVELRAALLDAGDRVTQPIRPGRPAWLQVARGALEVDGVALDEGDGAAIRDAAEVTVSAAGPADVLLFDRPRARESVPSAPA